MSNEIKEKINDYISKIYNGEYSEDEWLALNNDFNDFIIANNLSADDLKLFCESGAGEMLSMICNGILYERGLISE